MNLAENMVSSGDADMISICRPFICEPGLVNRCSSGDGSPVKCTSYSLCINSARDEGGLLECRRERLQREKAIA